METLQKYGLLLLCFLSFGLVGCDSEEKESSEDVLVKNVILDQTSVELKEGAVLTLSATVTPKNATNKELLWTSDNETVAVVQNGEVTAVSAGYATITAKTTDGSKKSATCEVKVVERRPGEILVEKISLNKSAVSLNEGETARLIATVTPDDATDALLSWVSTNEEVAVVSEGVITAVGAGSAVVKAVANDGSGVSASCAVTVISNGGGDSKAMSPIEVKNKLESAGITFVNAIKATTHQNLVDLMDYATVAFEDFEFDEAYLEKLENLVEESGYDEDYARGINPVRAMVDMTGLCLNTAKSGAQLSTRAADIYTLTVKAGLKDLYGKFTPDYANEIWKWNSGVKDRLEVEFADGDGQQWVATLKGSSTTTRLKITVQDKYKYGSEYVGGPYDEDYSWSESGEERLNYTIDIPKEITFVVKCGGKTVVDLKVNSSLAFEMNLNTESEDTNYYYWYDYDYYGSYWPDHSESENAYTFDVNYSNLNMDAKMKVNGYEETFKTDITKSGITASAGVKIDGRNMLSASASINADMDALITDAQDEEFKARNIKNFSMKFDALGEVQIDAECSDFKNLYDAILYLNEAEGIEQANSWLDEVNAAYTAKLRFDNTSTTQATFELEAMEENNGWDSYIYTYPVMVFASNNSRYSLDEYFTETGFSDLIDAVERLAGQFEDLYGDYFESEEEDYYPGYGGY